MRAYPRMAKMNHAPDGCPAVFDTHGADFGVWVPVWDSLNAKQVDPSGFREHAGGIGGVTRR